MILDHFIVGFRKRFPERALVIRPEDAVAAIPLGGLDIDWIEVQDELHELIVFAADVTHTHFGCYDQSLGAEEREIKVATAVLDFLARVFAHEVRFYRHPAGGGGWRIIDVGSQEDPGWSIGMER